MKDHPLYWDFMEEKSRGVSSPLSPDELRYENAESWFRAIRRAERGDNAELIKLFRAPMQKPMPRNARWWLVDVLERTQFQKTKSGARKTPAYIETEAKIRVHFWRWLVDRYVAEGAASDKVAAGKVADEFGVSEKKVINAIERVATKKKGRPKRPSP